MADVREIYNRLLAQDYAEEVFSDVPGPRKREGKEIVTTCPYCSSNRFSFSTTEPVWKCWSCNRAGDWLDHLQQHRGLDFKEALAELARPAGVEVNGSGTSRESHADYERRALLLEAAHGYFTEHLFSEDARAQGALQYLLQRGYTEEEIRAMDVGAYTSQRALREHLEGLGYKNKELVEAGLFTDGFGETHTITILWRDASSRGAGLTCRATDPGVKPKYKYSRGMKRTEALMGLRTARRKGKAVLVEGVLDVRYLQAKGSSWPAVAVGGTSVSAAQVKMLEDAGVVELILCLDSDHAGQDATERAIRTLRDSSVRPYVLALPDGYKDPDELIRKEGAVTWEAVLERAVAWPTWMAHHLLQKHDTTTALGIDRVFVEAGALYASTTDPLHQRMIRETLVRFGLFTDEEVVARLERFRESKATEEGLRTVERAARAALGQAKEGDLLGAEEGLRKALESVERGRGVELPGPYLLEDLVADLTGEAEGFKTGWPSLDSFVRLRPGAITIVAGRPGHGKTTAQLNLLLNLLRSYQGHRFHLVSYEEHRRDLALKLILILSGEKLHNEHNQNALKNYLKEKRGTNPAIERAVEEYEGFIRSGRLTLIDTRMPVEDLAIMLDHLLQAGDTGGVFVDYIQRIPARQEASVPYLKIKHVSSVLLDLAIRHNVAVVMGAQFGRDKASQGSRKVKLDNLREAGDIENDAHLVLGLWNEAQDQAEEEGRILSNEVELQVHVLKNRSGTSHRSVKLNWEMATLQITDGRAKMMGLPR